MYDTEREAAIRAARKAKDVINEYHHSDLRLASATDQKGDVDGWSNDLVTEADHRAQRAVKEVLDEEFPEDRFIGEETHDSNYAEGTDREWVVDPIDGTVNFSTGLPLYNTSIAFREGGETKVGVVASPTYALDRMWVATRGEGAHVMSFDGSDRRDISVTNHDQLDGAMIACFTDCETRLLEHGEVNTRRLASAALVLALVAEGRLDGYCLLLELSEWDVAAGYLLIEEAGGQVTELKQYDDGRMHPRVASNDALHDELCDVLDPLTPEHI